MSLCSLCFSACASHLCTFDSVRVELRGKKERVNVRMLQAQRRDSLVTATWRFAFPSSITSITSSGLVTNRSVQPWVEERHVRLGFEECKRTSKQSNLSPHITMNAAFTNECLHMQRHFAYVHINRHRHEKVYAVWQFRRNGENFPHHQQNVTLLWRILSSASKSQCFAA